MTERIEGQVARVLTDQRLIINRGEEHGVKLGMRFAILTPSGIDVPDPETGEILGSVEVARTIVKVIAIEQRMSIARTFRTLKSNGIFGSLTGPTERRETLVTDESTAEREIDPSESKVRIGDRVVEVHGDEFEGMVLNF